MNKIIIVILLIILLTTNSYPFAPMLVSCHPQDYQARMIAREKHSSLPEYSQIDDLARYVRKLFRYKHGI